MYIGAVRNRCLKGFEFQQPLQPVSCGCLLKPSCPIDSDRFGLFVDGLIGGAVPPLFTLKDIGLSVFG